MIKKLRLYRNTRRRRLGGVCAGIADLLNINVSWVRTVYLLSIFLSFGITFWSYVFIWIVFPAKPSLPIPEVSKKLVRELKKLDRWVRKAHRQLDHRLADKVEETFDAIKMLVGQMESSTSENNNILETWNESKTSFIYLIKQLLLATDTSGDTNRDKIVKNLDSLKLHIHQIGHNALQSEIKQSNVKSDDEAPEWRAWKTKMLPIFEQLNDRVGPQVLSILKKIEQKLAYLLTQEDQSELFDLSRFEVKKIANTYLPDALNEYLKLPSELARSQRLSNNFTAEEILSEQLIRLDHTLEELAVSLFEKDAQGLLIHGRFLKDKFADQIFKIDVS